MNGRRRGLSDRTLSVSEPLDLGVGPWEYEPNMPILGPLDEVGRSTLGSVDLQDLRIAIVLTFVVGLDDESVSDTCLHCSASSFTSLHIAPRRA